MGFRVWSASLSVCTTMAAYELFMTRSLDVWKLLLTVGAFAAFLTVAIVVMGEADDYYWS